jgi:hypothetical protein
MDPIRRPAEILVGGSDPKLDPGAFAPGGGDRRVGVRH